MLTLEVKKRDIKESAEKIRESGFMPAVYYGPKQASTPVSISAVNFKKVFEKAGESTIVVLKDGSEEIETLIHDVDYDALTETPIHADFYVVEKGKKVTVHVPLEFVGVSGAEKNLGGTLVKVMHEVEIEALPKDLPHSLEVDISSLVDFESQILVKDIKLPAGIEFKSGEEEVVALVQAAREEVVEEVPATFDPNAIEVEKKGKDEEEGATEEAK